MKTDYCFMERQNKNKQKRISIATYFTVTLFTLIMNFLLLIFITKDFISNFEFYINQYLKLYTIKPVIFPPLGKFAAISLFINLFFLLVVEFLILLLFRKQLNRLIKIDNLFTVKKITLLIIIMIIVQVIISCWLW